MDLLRERVLYTCLGIAIGLISAAGILGTCAAHAGTAPVLVFDAGRR